ncbi:MAG: hypothetical protein ACLTDV_03160 [Eubacterium sp.]
MYYQVNTTYYNALGENEQALLLARALQIFMPGKPRVWYLDLFAGKNDHEAVKEAGEGGHKINRTGDRHSDPAGTSDRCRAKTVRTVTFSMTPAERFTEDADIQIPVRWSGN